MWSRSLSYNNNYKDLYTQLLMGDNDLNNHKVTALAMVLQSCKHLKTRNTCRIVVALLVNWNKVNRIERHVQEQDHKHSSLLTINTTNKHKAAINK